VVLFCVWNVIVFVRPVSNFFVMIVSERSAIDVLRTIVQIVILFVRIVVKISAIVVLISVNMMIALRDIV